MRIEAVGVKVQPGEEEKAGEEVVGVARRKYIID